VRVVLDPNVIISALLSPEGAPSLTLRAWLQGHFELVVSPLMLEELSRALAYPKLRKRIEPQEADRVVEWLRATGTMAADPDSTPPARSPDPGDDYLIALAESERAALVSGGQHLLGLTKDLPVYSPTGFLKLLNAGREQRQLDSRSFSEHQ
jgi:putative PIN family toxin of toxin-antitoxin system